MKATPEVMRMTDKVVVLVTAGSAEECGKIARAVVEQRLAACVNILGPIRSVYRWKGTVEDEQEHLMVMKTEQKRFPALREEVERLHSYDTPEVICLPIAEGSEKYLNWLAESVREER